MNLSEQEGFQPMQDTAQEYQKQIKELEQQVRLLKEQVDFLTRKLYGTKSEKTSTLEIEGQMSLFNEIETYGFATYRRIYGNWTKNNGWSENILLENSITPIQQFNYTSGKNSSDMTMVIDAMDILYAENVDGFCLVSSDSDFTKLASRCGRAGCS